MEHDSKDFTLRTEVSKKFKLEGDSRIVFMACARMVQGGNKALAETALESKTDDLGIDYARKVGEALEEFSNQLAASRTIK